MKNRNEHLKCVIVSILMIYTGTFGNEMAAETINGHAYVDLGLSVKWATCNVGAASPGDYGNCYAFGEITTKSSCTSSNSTWEGKEVTEEEIKGNPLYDAARANWGGTWRLPTVDEMSELVINCAWTWTTQGGYEGFLVTGPNGKSIFLPAAGYYFSGTRHNGSGVYGYYWSCSPIDGDTNNAYYLYFYGSCFHTLNYSRFLGFSVRPVTE